MSSAEVYLDASRIPSGVSGLPGLSKKKMVNLVHLPPWEMNLRITHNQIGSLKFTNGC